MLCLFLRSTPSDNWSDLQRSKSYLYEYGRKETHNIEQMTGRFQSACRRDETCELDDGILRLNKNFEDDSAYELWGGFYAKEFFVTKLKNINLLQFNQLNSTSLCGWIDIICSNNPSSLKNIFLKRELGWKWHILSQITIHTLRPDIRLKHLQSQKQTIYSFRMRPSIN